MCRIVIVGSGHAGNQLAFSLREHGFTGEVLLVNGEEALPYYRPALSKEYLRSGERSDFLLRAHNAYSEARITEIKGLAASVDSAMNTLTFETGEIIGYDHLVLAIGTQLRRINVPRGDAGVYYLKSLVDSEALRAKLPYCESLTVIGAGFIGLEVSAYAVELGINVRVINAGDRVMARAVSQDIGDYFESRHKLSGVEFKHNASIVDIISTTSSHQIILSSGEEIWSDLVLAGIGVQPDTRLAATAGLEIDDGIVVDKFLCTNVENISAIGDCARFPTPHSGSLVRLESVQNANDQARTLARRLTGLAEPYVAVPWFWSNQGAEKLQIVGLPCDADTRIVRGSIKDGKFSVFSFQNGVLATVESVNQPADHMLARRLLTNRVHVPEALVRDSSKSLKSIVIQPHE